MVKEAKLFLKRVREAWATEFPCLEAVDLNEVPRRPVGSNFRCADYFVARKTCYFVSFNFSQRRKGEFSVGITVSPSLDRSVLDPSEVEQPGPMSIGAYSMADFLNCQSFHWDLVNVTARTNEVLNEFGIPVSRLPENPLPNVWVPTSYALGPDGIIEQAIYDVTEKLRIAVFPRLAIECKNKRHRTGQV